MVDAVREIVKAEVFENKKFELLAKKITDAKQPQQTTFAAKTCPPGHRKPQKASFSSPAINGAYEPKVVRVHYIARWQA